MQEVLQQATEYGPLVFIAIFAIGKTIESIYTIIRDRQEFNQEITRDSLSGEYDEKQGKEYSGTSLVAKIAQMETDLKYQSKKMKSIEKQTTNHVSEIQNDIKDMRKERADLREKIGEMSECLNQIDKKLN